MLNEMLGSIVWCRTWWWTILQASYSPWRISYCSCTSGESQAMLAVFPISIHNSRGIFLSEWGRDFHVSGATVPGATNGASGASRSSQSYHNHSHCALVPVIQNPSYLKPHRNTPPGSDSPLKFTLVSLHSTSSLLRLRRIGKESEMW